MFARILCVTALLMLSVPALHADEVQFGNNRLSGTILGMAGGKLRIGTEQLGEVPVSWTLVTDVRSDGDLAVYAEGGVVVVGVLEGIDRGVLQVKTSEGTKQVDLQQVNLISTELPRGEKPAPVVKWKGKVQFGFGTNSGNTDRYNYLVGGELRRRGPVTEVVATAQGERGKTKGTANATTGESSWVNDVAYSRANLTINRNQSGRTYLSLSSNLEQNDVSHLMLRQNHALSLGYRLVQRTPNTWQVEIGGNYVWEKYDDTGTSANYNQDDVTVRLRSLTEWRVFKASRIKLNIVANPSVRARTNPATGNKVTGVRAVTDLTFSVPLTGALNLELSGTHDYNTNVRPEGVKTSDLRTRTTLVYGF